MLDSGIAFVILCRGWKRISYRVIYALRVTSWIAPDQLRAMSPGERIVDIRRPLAGIRRQHTDSPSRAFVRCNRYTVAGFALFMPAFAGRTHVGTYRSVISNNRHRRRPARCSERNPQEYRCHALMEHREP